MDEGCGDLLASWAILDGDDDKFGEELADSELLLSDNMEKDSLLACGAAKSPAGGRQPTPHPPWILTWKTWSSVQPPG